MKPVAVIPMNDPDGVMFPHLKSITPQLKTLFSQVFVSVPLNTRLRFPEHVSWVQSDTFFKATCHEVDLPVGEFLFGKSLDFTWCHLATRADRLLELIPEVNNRDISIVAELVLAVRDEVRTRDVDWLSWEDPFILSKEPQALKEEREESIGETHKRLGYVIPMLQLLVAASKDD
jgi:hypothetical protein